MLEYLFETSYSGRDYWGNNGVDFPAAYKKMRVFVNNQKGKISVLQFENMIAKSLTGIFDGHLSITGKKEHRFFSHQDAYFSGILLEKQGDDYVVIESNYKQVPQGAKFTEEEKEKYLFKTLSPKGKEHFLLGILSFKKTASLHLSFESKKITVPCHPAHIRKTKINRKHKGKVFFVDKKETIPVVTVLSFDSRFAQELKTFETYGTKLKNTPMFIWDLRGNGGGSSFFSATFIKNLNNTAISKTIGYLLTSPGTLQYIVSNFSLASLDEKVKKYIVKANKRLEVMKKKPLRKWNIEEDPWAVEGKSDEENSGNYKGKMVVLTNRYIASSGESAVAYSYSVKNCFRVGENTAGIGTFGEVGIYYLPNSSIWFRLPCKIFFTPGQEEGKGFTPDYWLDTDKPIAEVVRWLNNPEKYRFQLVPEKH